MVLCCLARKTLSDPTDQVLKNKIAKPKHLVHQAIHTLGGTAGTTAVRPVTEALLMGLQRVWLPCEQVNYRFWEFPSALRVL